MPAPSLPARPQTIKQAKAAFKARSRPSLTEREQRQLERSVELDRRAWRARENEKKKAEATKKRAEKEKRDLEARAKVQMGSQRRCDRFGYKSSQMHLGAFLNKTGVENGVQKENMEDMSEASEEDDFEDVGVDDETLLEALDGTKGAETAAITPIQAHARSDGVPHTTQDHQDANLRRSSTEPSISVTEELDSFWDELDSSTQIARDLDSNELNQAEQKPVPQARSFTSDDFDLTVEDLEELHSTPSLQKKLDEARKLMPPPPLPAKHTSYSIEFTMSELERFVDDDLQLTQAEPG